jgi:hypothetical protein
MTDALMCDDHMDLAEINPVQSSPVQPGANETKLDTLV